MKRLNEKRNQEFSNMNTQKYSQELKDFCKHIRISDSGFFAGQKSNHFFMATNGGMEYLFGKPEKTYVSLEEVEEYFGPQSEVDIDSNFVKTRYRLQLTEPAPIDFELISCEEEKDISADNQQIWLIYVDNMIDEDIIDKYICRLFYNYCDDAQFRSYVDGPEEDDK